MSTPAGWYPDPESPNEQRYWDGERWTEHRAPRSGPPAAAPVAPPPPAPVPAPGYGASGQGAAGYGTPPPGAPGHPMPGVTPAHGAGVAAPKKSRKGLWITLGVIAVVVVGGFVALVALSDSASDKIESLLPAALEANYEKQGLTVDVTKADCGDVDMKDGPFEVACTLTIAGTSRTLPATVRGTISGNTISVTSAESESNIVNEDLAISAVQQLVDKVANGVEVVSCDLPESVLVLRKGDTFTCETDSDEELEITATSGRTVEITEVR